MGAAWEDENSKASLQACLDDSSADMIIDQEFLLELFRDCWLAPITTDSPLAVEEQQRLSAEASTADNPCGATNEHQQPSEVPTKHKNPGRPKLTRKKDLHTRYRKRLKRRKSDRCFIDSAWSAYRRTAMHLADEIIKSRPKRRDDEHPQRATASTWNRDVSQFLKSLASVITGLCRVGAEGADLAPPAEVATSPRPPD